MTAALRYAFRPLYPGHLVILLLRAGFPLSARNSIMTDAVNIVRAFYNAIAAGDVPGVLSVLHPNLEWTEAEGFPYYSGTWHSPDEVVQKLLAPLMRDWDDFSAVAEDFLVDGERVVSLGAYAGICKATGKAMRAPFAHVWRIVDGKLQQFNMYTDTLLIAQAMQP
jgi:ketosteroid isomerase-like protein